MRAQNKHLAGIVATVIPVTLCLALNGRDVTAQTSPRATPTLDQLAEAVQIIRRDYIESVDERKLATGCRSGMLEAVSLSKLSQVTATAPARHASLLDDFPDLYSSISQHSPESGTQAEFAVACLRGALRALDPLSAFLDREEFTELRAPTELGAVGLEFAIEGGYPKVVGPLEGSPAERAGIKGSDVLVRIDAASTHKMTLPQAARALRGPVGSSVTLAIERKGSAEPRIYTLTREIVRVQSVKSRLVAPDYAYIRVSQFQEVTGRLVAQAFENAYRESQGELKGLILDLRNNPGGLLIGAVAVAAVFLSHGTLIVSTDGRIADAKMRLTASRENYLRSRYSEDYIASLPPAVKTVPMVVLVNDATKSGSELVAAALQFHARARILGGRTQAYDTLQSILPLRNNTALKLTIARLLGPGGKSIGPVIPDIALEASDIPASGYGSPEDVQLSQAIKFFDAELNGS